MAPHLSTNSSHPSATSSSLSVDSNPKFKSKSNRLRSLRSLFHVPLGSRSKYFVYDETQVDVDAVPMKANTLVGNSVLPQDIIREIVDFLSPADILNFSLASSYLRLILLPALYDTIILKSSKHCRLTLTMLCTRPYLCSYIKKLAVRPNYYLAWPKSDDTLDEGWVVKMIIALSKNLNNMHTFDWDGLELPHDQLWVELRLNCPQLKGIFTNVGSRPLNPQSALFSFSNLTSFSLIIRHGLRGSELFPVLEEIPPRFWDMLFNRCPDLQELAICSFSSSSRLFNFECITQGRWPKLHTLTLGSFGYQNDFTIGPPGLTGTNDNGDLTGANDNGDSGPTTLSLGQFLDLHSELKYIRFLWNFKRWMSPTSIPLSLTPSISSLPNLDTFIGVYQQLIHIPHPETIETLDLTCEPVYESRLTTVVPILRKLTGLTSLDIWMHVLDMSSWGGDGDGMASFRAVLEACPGLVDFHFMCTTSFTVTPLNHLLSYLRLLPRLKRFSLTKGHKYGDENMLSTVLRVLKSCPKLLQVNIRWAREKCLNHLKQEGVYDVVEWEENSEGGVSGVKGQPKALMVLERGIPLVGKPFSRRYKYTLPGRAGGGGKGDWSRQRGGWMWSRRKRVPGGVASKNVGTTVGVRTSAERVNIEIESIGRSEIDFDSEVDVDTDREEEEDIEENNIINTNLRGKEVERIGLSTPTMN